MSALRKEIEQEMARTRLDKGRLFDLLLKIVDNAGQGGAPGVRGAPGPAGPAGPPGPAGPAGECKCDASAKTSVKKVPIKKKPASVDA